MAHDQKIRAFLAIELAADLKKALSEHLAGFETQMTEFRLIAPVHWHLTLHFFGNVLPDDLKRLETPLAHAMSTAKPFEFELDRFGYFPDEGRARIFWIGLGGDRPSLTDLKKKIDQVLKISGFPIEPRPFHPHITLARAKSRSGALVKPAALPLPRKLPSQPVQRLTLFRSDLTPEGPHYLSLFSFPFARS